MRAGESREEELKLCIFAHRLRAERVELFTEGLVVGVELDGWWPQRMHARRSAATAWDPSPATALVHVTVPNAATAGHFCCRPRGFLSAVTAWGASAATAWVPSPATAWGA